MLHKRYHKCYTAGNRPHPPWWFGVRWRIERCAWLPYIFLFLGEKSGSWQGKLNVEDRMSTASTCTVDVSILRFLSTSEAQQIPRMNFMSLYSTWCQHYDDFASRSSQVLNHIHCYLLSKSITIDFVAGCRYELVPYLMFGCASIINRKVIYDIFKLRTSSLNFYSIYYTQVLSYICNLSTPRGRWSQAPEISSPRSNSGSPRAEP